VLSFISNRLCGFRPRREGYFLIISGRTIVRPTWQSSGNFLDVRPGGTGFAQVAGGSAFGDSSNVNTLCYYYLDKKDLWVVLPSNLGQAVKGMASFSNSEPYDAACPPAQFWRQYDSRRRLLQQGRCEQQQWQRRSSKPCAGQHRKRAAECG